MGNTVSINFDGIFNCRKKKNDEKIKIYQNAHGNIITIRIGHTKVVIEGTEILSVSKSNSSNDSINS